MTLFPFNMYARDHGTYVHSPELAQAVWMRLRDGQSWYAVECEVLSEQSIMLKVYGMEDAFYGGIGKKTHELEAVVQTEKEKELLRKAIESHATYLAKEEFARIQENKQNTEILILRKKLFNI